MDLLRIATFNIRHGRGLDNVVDLRRTATAISETDAQVVALQELDRFQERSNRRDQLELLAGFTGYEISFWPTVRKKSGAEYGIALATRRDVGLSPDLRFEPLPRVGDEEPRGAIVGRFEQLGFSVVATHLSTDRKVRRAQTDRLLELGRDLEPPVLIMGDFNHGRFGLRPLTQAGFDPGRKIEHTMSSRSLRWQIDFVLVGPPAQLASTHTITTDASDHVPLVAEVMVSGAGVE